LVPGRVQVRTTFIMLHSMANQNPARSFSGLPTNLEDNAIIRQLRPTDKQSTPVDLPALQNASRVLHDQLLKDSQIIPDLGDILSTRMF
jgi:nuclear pore complex protein Nup155